MRNEILPDRRLPAWPSSARAQRIPLFLALAALAAGCANGSSRYDNRPADPYSHDVSFTSLSLSSSAEGQYSCPLQPNVNPANTSVVTSAADTFTICTDSASPAYVLLHGTTVSSSVVCVFPALAHDATQIYAQPNPATGQPWYQCQDTANLNQSTYGASIGSSTPGAQFAFPGASFNAVFVVEAPYVTQMQTCLANGDPNACPQLYSYGKFR